MKLAEALAGRRQAADVALITSFSLTPPPQAHLSVPAEEQAALGV
jgi:hypothetical protein